MAKPTTDQLGVSQNRPQTGCRYVYPTEPTLSRTLPGSGRGYLTLIGNSFFSLSFNNNGYFECDVGRYVIGPLWRQLYEYDKKGVDLI